MRTGCFPEGLPSWCSCQGHMGDKSPLLPNSRMRWRPKLGEAPGAWQPPARRHLRTWPGGSCLCPTALGEACGEQPALFAHHTTPQGWSTLKPGRQLMGSCVLCSHQPKPSAPTSPLTLKLLGNMATIMLQSRAAAGFLGGLPARVHPRRPTHQPLQV